MSNFKACSYQHDENLHGSHENTICWRRIKHDSLFAMLWGLGDGKASKNEARMKGKSYPMI